MNTSMKLHHGRRLAGLAACLSSVALLLGGCVADSSDSDPTSELASKDGADTTDSEDIATESDALTLKPLSKPADANLRIASWNTFRGSVFPKTDSLWKKINTAGTYETERTEATKRIFKAVNADIWLLQEVVYSEDALDVPVSDVNAKIKGYMDGTIGGGPWKVDCNGEGLCTMIRGSISLEKSCVKNGRSTGHLVKLNSLGGATLLLANTHYMSPGHADDTKNIITGSKASAVFVGGDFNDGLGGPRYNIIDGISSPVSLSPIAMQHAVDSNAIHLSGSVKSSKPINTKGYVEFGPIGNNQSQVNKVYGGHIDHFFFGAQKAWPVKKNLTLNTLLLAKDALAAHGLKPLDVSLLPSKQKNSFADFMSTGTIKTVAGEATKIDHDHLPMIVDFQVPAGAAVSSSLACP